MVSKAPQKTGPNYNKKSSIIDWAYTRKEFRDSKWTPKYLCNFFYFNPIETLWCKYHENLSIRKSHTWAPSSSINCTTVFSDFGT